MDARVSELNKYQSWQVDRPEEAQVAKTRVFIARQVRRMAGLLLRGGAAIRGARVRKLKRCISCQIYHLEQARGKETRFLHSSEGVRAGSFIAPRRRRYHRLAGVMAQQVSERRRDRKMENHSSVGTVVGKLSAPRWRGHNGDVGSVAKQV